MNIYEPAPVLNNTSVLMTDFAKTAKQLRGSGAVSVTHVRANTLSTHQTLRPAAKGKGKGKWVMKNDLRNKGAKNDDTAVAPIPPQLQAATPSSNEQIAGRKRMDRASDLAVGSPYSLSDGTSLFQLNQRPRLWTALREMGIDLK